VTITVDPTIRTLAAAGRIAELAPQFVATMREAGRLATLLAALEAEHRAALNIAGQRDPRPGARELAAEVALGFLEPLRPHVPFVTLESACRAAEELTDD